MNLFASGFLVVRKAAGTSGIATARKFGQLQEIQFDDSFDEKKLYALGSAPVRSFRGQRKVEGKAKAARINLSLFSEVYYGGTVATGANIPVYNEVHTIPSATTYEFAASNAGTSGANFVEDLGVEYASTGIPFDQVASTATPTVGQYSVDAEGNYTFAEADAGIDVVVSYVYSVTTGQHVAVPTSLQQESPYFEAVLANSTDGGFIRKCYRCTSSKLSMGFKQGEIVIPEFDFSVLDPGTGVLYRDDLATA